MQKLEYPFILVLSFKTGKHGSLESLNPLKKYPAIFGKSDPLEFFKIETVQCSSIKMNRDEKVKLLLSYFFSRQ